MRFDVKFRGIRVIFVIYFLRIVNQIDLKIVRDVYAYKWIFSTAKLDLTLRWKWQVPRWVCVLWRWLFYRLTISELMLVHSILLNNFVKHISTGLTTAWNLWVELLKLYKMGPSCHRCGRQIPRKILKLRRYHRLFEVRLIVLWLGCHAWLRI